MVDLRDPLGMPSRRAPRRAAFVTGLVLATAVSTLARAEPGRAVVGAAAQPLVPDDEEDAPPPLPQPKMMHDTRLGFAGVGLFAGTYLLSDLMWSQMGCGQEGCGATGLVFIPVAGPLLAQGQVSARLEDEALGPAFVNLVFWPVAVMASVAQASGVVMAIVGFGAKTKKVYPPNEASIRLDIRPSSVGLAGTW